MHDWTNLQVEIKRAMMQNTVKTPAKNKVNQTSKFRRSYQVRFLPIGFKSDMSSWRKTYSVHQTAVSMGFIGKSLKIVDIFLTLVLKLPCKTRDTALWSWCSVISEISSAIATPISSSRIALKSWSMKITWKTLQQNCVRFSLENIYTV